METSKTVSIDLPTIAIVALVAAFVAFLIPLK